MTRYKMILVLCLVIFSIAFGAWFYESPMITNRTDEHGVSGSDEHGPAGQITLRTPNILQKNSNWEFTHCTPTVKDCGRLE